MGRLIDDIKLKASIAANEILETNKPLEDIIDEQPTAYDLEAVVKQIEEFVECNDECSKTFYQGRGCTACAYKDIINIVRRGGVINGEET